METNYFTTVDELISYSRKRTKIRVNNMRLHRMKKGKLKELISKNRPESLAKEKDNKIFLTCHKEKFFRDIVRDLQLPISTHIL